MFTGSEIRRKFLDFFIQKGHREVHSSSLVPADDPTLLFTNAGMNQFKDVFLGLEKRDYARATTSQKCVRAGGKHNDLENVGFTNRHHTFFEMLGNFSFGDYFKEKAIPYAWELMTSPEWFGIDKDKLYVTIFKGENGVPRDAEAYDLWLGHVPKDRIYEFGSKDNFWQMGDTGPCGPCSEIHYDMGVVASDQGHTDCTFGCECGRYVELWNLVFMQFDRDASGKLTPLPKPSIDTGMGLERITAVLQGVISNYETDLFTPLIKRAADLTGAPQAEPGLRPGGAGEGTRPYASGGNAHVGADAPVCPAEQSSAGSKSAASLRVIADHSRAATFLISDGVVPSNEGRGYVLRKIIRRAITHGRLLGQEKPFLHEMVFAVRDLMQDAYPELKETADRASESVRAEETRFAHTLDLGLSKYEEVLQKSKLEAGKRILNEAAKQYRQAGLPHADEIAKFVSGFSEADYRNVAEGRLQRLFPDQGLSDLQRLIASSSRSAEFERIVRGELSNTRPTISGGDGFRLYDTFGMPLDFMEDAARDQGIVFDHDGFNKALDEQRERARASWKGAAKQTANPVYQQLPKSAFEGYRQTRSDNCEVLAIIKAGQGAQELKPGDSGEIILDHTPFYAESGGQVGDRGWF
jgi:alanyl-tRNA synthetase